jgi:uncharacterized protein (DUF983 family)
MIKKGTKLFSIINNKCPRCHQGDFFISSNPLNFKGTLKIHEKCPNCGLKYMIEPSFFYGAMYVSYALTVAIAVATFIICQLLDIDLAMTLATIIIVLILMIPYLVRISRLIYINMFVGYQSDDKKP